MNDNFFDQFTEDTPPVSKPKNIDTQSTEKPPKPKKQIPFDLIESIALKYLGTKKRWKNPACTEPDFLAVQKLLEWIKKEKN
jgi:hypothetical protein